MESVKDESQQQTKESLQVFPTTRTENSSHNHNTSNQQQEAIMLDNQEEEKELQIDDSKLDSKPSASKSPHQDIHKQESEAFHMEILLGLFLRSTDEELQQLAQKAGVSNTLVNMTQHKTMTEEMKQDSIDKPSLMPIVAHVLRDISQEDCISSQTQLTQPQINHLFPQQYKRENYASRTISELSSHILDKFISYTHEQNVPLSMSSTTENNDSHRPGLQTFPLEYNECSMNTFANWAFTPDTTQPAKEENLNFYYQPHAPFTFQQCNICRRYGHVEVECEELSKRTIPREHIKQALEMEQTVWDEFRIQHNLREFIQEERANRNCVELTMEQQYVRDPWLDVRTGKISEEQPPHPYSSTPSTKQTQQGHAGMYTAEESISEDDMDPCRTCGSTFRPADLLLCDGCDETFHRQCLVPPLDEVPEGDWFCDSCKTYDDEVDSITVIEGLDDFVIEQRKLSSNLDKLREREAEGGVGYKSNPFDAAMVVAPVDSVLKDTEKTSSSIEDGISLQDIRDDGDDPVFDTLSTMLLLSSSRTLNIGDLCWAKRRCSTTNVAGLLGKDFFWPAIVMEVHDSSIAYDGVRQTPYIVRMFNVSAGGRLRASAILPFFEFFDELGLQRLEAFQDQQPSWWRPFSKGLREAINEVGFDSYDNALAFSKQILRDDNDSNGKGNQSESIIKKLIKTKKHSAEGTRPSEWDDAEVTEIDGITILTKRSEREDPNDVPRESLSPILEVDDNVQNQSREKTAEDEIDENKKFSLHSLNSEELRKVPIENLVGGLVAYSVTDSKSEERIIFGKSLEYNRAFGKVLVQNISNFESIIDGYSEKNESNLIACNVHVGSTQWIDLDDLFFLNHGPRDGNKKFCSSTLANTLQNTRDQLSTLRANVGSEDEVSLDEISLEETSISSVELGEQVTAESGEAFDSVDIGEKEDIEEKTLDSSVNLETEAPDRTFEVPTIDRNGSQIIECNTKAMAHEEVKFTGELKDNITAKGKDTVQIAKVNMNEGSIENKAVSNTQIAQEGLGGSAKVIEKRIENAAVSVLQTTRIGNDTYQEHKDKWKEDTKALVLESRKTFITEENIDDALDSTAQIFLEAKDDVKSIKESINEDRIEDVAVSVTEICQKEMETAESIKDSNKEDGIEDVAVSTAEIARKVEDNIEITDGGTEDREASNVEICQKAKDTAESVNVGMSNNRNEDEKVSAIRIVQEEIGTVESVKNSINETRIEDVAVSTAEIGKEANGNSESIKDSINKGRAVETSMDCLLQEVMKPVESVKDSIDKDRKKDEISVVHDDLKKIDSAGGLKDNINEGRVENVDEAVPIDQVSENTKEISESHKDNINDGRGETVDKAVPIDQVSEEATDIAESNKDNTNESRAVPSNQETEEAKDTSEIVELRIEDGADSNVQVTENTKEIAESRKDIINESRLEDVDVAVPIDQVTEEATGIAESLKVNTKESRIQDVDVAVPIDQISEGAKDTTDSLKDSIIEGRLEDVDVAVPIDQVSEEATDSAESLKGNINQGNVVPIEQVTEETKDMSEIVKPRIEDGVDPNVQVTEEVSFKDNTKESRIEDVDVAVPIDQISEEAKDTTDSLKDNMKDGRIEDEDVAAPIDQVSEEATDSAEYPKSIISKTFAERRKRRKQDYEEFKVASNFIMDTKGENTSDNAKDSMSTDVMEKVSEVETTDTSRVEVETCKTTERKNLGRVEDLESSEKVSNVIDHSTNHRDAIVHKNDLHREESSENPLETSFKSGTLGAAATSEEKSIKSTKKQSKVLPSLSTLHSIELLLNKNRSKRKKITENQSTIQNDLNKNLSRRKEKTENQSTVQNDAKKEVESNVIDHSTNHRDAIVHKNDLHREESSENPLETSFKSGTLGADAISEEKSIKSTKKQSKVLPSLSTLHSIELLLNKNRSRRKEITENQSTIQNDVNQEGNKILLGEATTADETLDRGSNVESTEALVSLQNTAISAAIDLSTKDGTEGQADQGAIPVNSRNVSVSNRIPVDNQNKMELSSESSKNTKSGTTESLSSMGAICREKENVGVATKDLVGTEESDAAAVAIQKGEEKVNVIENSREESNETKQSSADTNEISSSIPVDFNEPKQLKDVQSSKAMSKVASKLGLEVVEDVETIDKSTSLSVIEKGENIGEENNGNSTKSGDDTGKAALDTEIKRLQQSEKDNSRPVASVTENLVELNLQTSNQKETDICSPVATVDDISNKGQKVQERDNSMDISKSSGEDMDISISSGESVRAESTAELGKVIVQKNLDLNIENSGAPSNAASNAVDENEESLLASLSSSKPNGDAEDEEETCLKMENSGASDSNTTLENTASKEKTDRLDIEIRPTDSASTVSKVKSDVESSKVVISDKTSVPKAPLPATQVVIEIKDSDTDTSVDPAMDTIQKLNERPKKKRQIDLTGVTFKSTSPPKIQKEISTASSLPYQKDTLISKKKVSNAAIGASRKPQKKIIEEGLTSPSTKKLNSDSTTMSSHKKRTGDTITDMPFSKKRPVDSTTSLTNAKNKTDETTKVLTTPMSKTDEAAANASIAKEESFKNPDAKKKDDESSANVSNPKRKTGEPVTNTSNPKKKGDELVVHVSDPPKKSSETEVTVTNPKKKGTEQSTAMLTPKKRPNESKNVTHISKKPRESPPSKSLVGLVEKRIRTPTHKKSSSPPVEAKKPKATKAKAKKKNPSSAEKPKTKKKNPSSAEKPNVSKKKNPSSAEKPKAPKKKKEEMIVDDVVVDPINTHERADEGIFYVERIISDRTKGKKKEYLIKWKGYSNEHNTWEREENILDPIFLKKYLCVKYIAILTATPEGKKEGSNTRNVVNALKRGIVLMDKKPPKELSNNRVCPLCWNLQFDHKKFGGHVRKHKDEANYVHMKEIARFAERSWFKK